MLLFNASFILPMDYLLSANKPNMLRCLPLLQQGGCECTKRQIECQQGCERHWGDLCHPLEPCRLGVIALCHKVPIVCQSLLMELVSARMKQNCVTFHWTSLLMVE